MSEYSDQHSEKASIDSQSATPFIPDEASDELQQKFQRLWFYNEDLRRDRNNTNSTEVRRREKNHILDAVSSSLELPEYQHKEAKQILRQTNFNNLVEGRYLSLEVYCFAICIFVHNKRVNRFENKYIPKEGTSETPELFYEVQEEIGITVNQLQQAIAEIRKEVKENV